MLKLNLLAGGSINGTARSVFEDQVCIYVRGVAAVTKKKWLKDLRFALGFLGQQIKPMTKQLEEVYEPGDEIYITGFSRGSASAREFAVKLNKQGLKTNDGKRIKNVPVEFLGCFDTVSVQVWKNLFTVLRNALFEIPTKSNVVREKGTVAPNVKQAVHLVSLDDNRQFGIPPSKPIPYPPVLMGHEERVHEVWFAGIHGDIGGNYFYKGLSDCACKYMQKCMENEGIQFMEAENISDDCLIIRDAPDVKVNKTDLKIEPNATMRSHVDETHLSYRKVMAFKNDKELPGGVVNIHESVLEHVEEMQRVGNYTVNPRLKDTDFRVVGENGKELKEKTTRLSSFLERYL